MLVQHMEQFKHEKKLVLWHIPSKYNDEMSTESVVVRYS